MLTIFITVFIVMLLTVIGMGIGVLCGRAPIKGSCGGLNNIGVERACGCTDVCAERNVPLAPEETDPQSRQNTSRTDTTEHPTLYHPDPRN